MSVNTAAHEPVPGDLTGSKQKIAFGQLDWGWVVMSILINIFAVATSFLAIFLSFRESCTGIVMNTLRRRYREEEIHHGKIKKGVTAFIILISWAAVVTNIPYSISPPCAARSLAWRAV